MIRRRFPLVLLVVLVAGCGAAKPTHTSVDVLFAQKMITHHAESLALVEMSHGRPVSAGFRELAARVGKDERAQTLVMSGWLKAWRKPVPPTGISGSGTANSDSASTGALPGQMDTDDLKAIQRRRGADFERAWLVMMRDHQGDAATLAGQELKDGSDPKALRLARRIKATSTAEVGELEKLIGS